MAKENIKICIEDLEDAIIYAKKLLLDVKKIKSQKLQESLQQYIDKRLSLLGELHALTYGVLQKPGALKKRKWYLKRITELLLKYPLLIVYINDMKNARQRKEFDPVKTLKKISK